MNRTLLDGENTRRVTRTIYGRGTLLMLALQAHLESYDDDIISIRVGRIVHDDEDELIVSLLIRA